MLLKAIINEANKSQSVLYVNECRQWGAQTLRGPRMLQTCRPLTTNDLALMGICLNVAYRHYCFFVLWISWILLVSSLREYRTSKCRPDSGLGRWNSGFSFNASVPILWFAHDTAPAKFTISRRGFWPLRAAFWGLLKYAFMIVWSPF